MYAKDIHVNGNNKTFKQLVKLGGSWAFAVRVLRMLSGMVLNIILVRVLAPSDVGVFFLLLSFTSVAVMLSFLGQGRTVTKQVAEAMSDDLVSTARGVIRTSFSICLVASIFWALVILLTGKWIALNIYDSIQMSQVIWLVAPFVIFEPITGIFAESFRGLHDIRNASIIGEFLSSALFVSFAVGIYILSGKTNLEILMVARIVCAAIVFGIAFFLIQARMDLFATFKRVSYTSLLQIGIPIMASNVAILLYSNVDLWMLGIFSNEENVAIYGSSARIILLILFPLHILNAVIPPIISEMYKKGDKTELENNLRKVSTICSLPGIAIVVLFLFFGKPLLNVLYGDFFVQGYLPLVLLSTGQLINILSGPNALVLMMTNYQRPIMIVNLLCLGLLIVLSFFGVKYFGLIGVACANAFIIMLNSIVLLILSKRLTGIATHFKMSFLWVLILKNLNPLSR